MRKFCIMAVAALMILTGCEQAKESVQKQTQIDIASMDSFDDSYYKIIKTESGDSELREGFYLDYGATSDFKNIGRGLQMLSTNYFSTSNHYMSEGQYLKLSLKNEMVIRKSKYSLQPQSGRVIENVKDPTMVQNIQEQDYFVQSGNKYVLKGMAFSIIIDPRNSKNQVLDEKMSDAAIESYGKESIEKLYNIIQTADEFKDVKDIPVLITVYQATDTANSSVNGRYILESYCQNGLGQINKVDHKNILFTSAEAESYDKTTYSDFSGIKAIVKNAATEAVGFIGKGRYVDGKIQSMVITASLNVKTSTELMYLTSIIADAIDSRFTYDFHISVLVKSQDELQAVIVKDKGQKSRSTYLY